MASIAVSPAMVRRTVGRFPAHRALIEANVWQQVPGAWRLEVYAIVTKPSIVSSNCYLLRVRDVLIRLPPG